MPTPPPAHTPAQPPRETPTQPPAQMRSATARTAGALSPHPSAQKPAHTSTETAVEKADESAGMWAGSVARRRATCRAVGQIALALAVGVGLAPRAQEVLRCASDVEVNREVCRVLFTPPALVFTLIGDAATALAALGLWATLRHTRVWIARACAIILAAPGPVWLVWDLLAEHDPDTGWTRSLVGSLITLPGPVVPLLLLLTSYRPSYRHSPSPDTDEPGPSGWLSMVLGPLVLLILGVEALERAVDLPPIAPWAGVLGAGLLYGLMRRRYPAAGAGHWLPATLILTALLIPEYTWLRWGHRLAEQVPGQATHDTIAWALTLATVAVLAGLQLATTRGRNRPPAAAGAPSGGQPIDPAR